MIFSNLLGALRKIAEKLRKMANDEEFIGMLDHLLDNAQAKVRFQLVVFFFIYKNLYIVAELEVQFRESILDQVQSLNLETCRVGL